ncbi:Protein of unknown function [Cribrihabitans marinus]|uniref:Nucleoside-triphosphatase THEP1 n=1 Tax=Cribrihabitans marinus TaxID=1227549 RepID=A0A1H6ZGP4_9RHOB|nr:DUF2478 domain-containing protein [Cribrihabitans marinus]GGH30654.1 hypothetical protein GCM10010973_20960 [Cribrihabitans marinus]SEJ52723.1 Protein of unknown function [Cribrihabitans marinus]
MNLAYVSTTERGATDRLLSAAAAHLAARGVALAGVVQSNTECADSSKCDMDLKVLPDGETIRISQSLGAGSRGCRLDPAGLELAVGLVGRSLDAGPRLLIVNKFGKHEADGRGFRPLIGEALARDIPVLVGLNGLNAERFLEFTDGAAEQLSPEIESIETWLNRVAPEGTAAA